MKRKMKYHIPHFLPLSVLLKKNNLENTANYLSKSIVKLAQYNSYIG